MAEQCWRSRVWTAQEVLAGIEALCEKPPDEYARKLLLEAWPSGLSLGLRQVLDLPIRDIDKRQIASLQWIPEWIVERVVRRTIETHALHSQVPEMRDWSARWLSGEDRTYFTAQAVTNYILDEAAQWAAYTAVAAAMRSAYWSLIRAETAAIRSRLASERQSRTAVCLAAARLSTWQEAEGRTVAQASEAESRTQLAELRALLDAPCVPLDRLC